MRILLSTILAISFSTACGEVAAPPATSYASLNAASSSSTFAPAPVFASRASVPADAIVIAPDSLDISFSLVGEPGVSNDDIRSRARSLVEDLRRVTHVAGDLVPSSVTVAAEHTKKPIEKLDDAQKIVIGGRIRFPLRADQDFWSRVELLRTLEVERQRFAGITIKQPVCVAIGQPEFHVTAPEAHRAELVKRWMNAARSIAEADKQDTKLTLTDCSLTQTQISQSALGPMEVALSLPIACHFSSGRVAVK